MHTIFKCCPLFVITVSASTFLYYNSITASVAAEANDNRGGLQKSDVDSLESPDRKYEVAIVHHALAGVRPAPDAFTLTLSHNKHILSQFPTIGYLLNVYWSPDGKYVAINNRRGNSGDYLWILSLNDGKLLRAPNDSDDFYRREVSRKFPECSVKSLIRDFTKARGWTSDSRLEVNTDLYYGDLKDEIVSINSVYQIINEKPQLVVSSVEKLPWPQPHRNGLDK